MTYSANVPSLSVTEQLDVEDIEAVFLAEFTPGEPVREILMDPSSALPPEVPQEELPEGEELTPEQLLASESFPTTPVASASGLRLHRVIGPDRQVVAQFDATADRCPLDFLGETGAIVATTQPGTPYTWKLVQMGPASEDGNVAPILAMRAATEQETERLNEMYPGWLEACKKFDEQAAAEADAVSDLPVMPAPKLVQ